VAIPLSGRVPGRASGPSRSSGRWQWRIAMYSGKVIGYLGFSRRGVFIGEGASSEVALVGLTIEGAGQPQAVPLVVWPTSGSSPSPLRFCGSSGEYLDFWILFRPIPRIFPV
jgi:hypothetical protein